MALNGAADGMDLMDVSSSSPCSGNTEPEQNAVNSGRYEVSKESIHTLKKWKTWKKVVVVTSLWIAYLLCTTAYSVINPFFPQVVSYSNQCS